MDLESCVLRIILCFQYPIHLSNKNIEFYHTISIETNIQAKMGFYPFHINFPAKYPMSETI